MKSIGVNNMYRCAAALRPWFMEFYALKMRNKRVDCDSIQSAKQTKMEGELAIKCEQALSTFGGWGKKENAELIEIVRKGLGPGDWEGKEAALGSPAAAD